MGGSILCVVKLILGVSPELILNAFYKGLGIPAIFMDESLEFFPVDNNIRPFFLGMPAFVLCSASANSISKKKDRKRSAILSVGSSYIEIVFVLLTKPIVIQMRFSKIQVGKPSLERLFFGLY